MPSTNKPVTLKEEVAFIWWCFRLLFSLVVVKAASNPETNQVSWVSPAPGSTISPSARTLDVAWLSTAPVYAPAFSLCTSEDACGTAIWPNPTVNADGSYTATLSLPDLSGTQDSALYVQMKDEDGTFFASSELLVTDDTASEATGTIPASDPSLGATQRHSIDRALEATDVPTQVVPTSLPPGYTLPPSFGFNASLPDWLSSLLATGPVNATVASASATNAARPTAQTLNANASAGGGSGPTLAQIVVPSVILCAFVLMILGMLITRCIGRRRQRRQSEMSPINDFLRDAGKPGMMRIVSSATSSQMTRSTSIEQEKGTLVGSGRGHVDPYSLEKPAPIYPSTTADLKTPSVSSLSPPRKEPPKLLPPIKTSAGGDETPGEWSTDIIDAYIHALKAEGVSSPTGVQQARLPDNEPATSLQVPARSDARSAQPGMYQITPVTLPPLRRNISLASAYTDMSAITELVPSIARGPGSIRRDLRAAVVEQSGRRGSIADGLETGLESNRVMARLYDDMRRG